MRRIRHSSSPNATTDKSCTSAHAALPTASPSLIYCSLRSSHAKHEQGWWSVRAGERGHLWSGQGRVCGEAPFSSLLLGWSRQEQVQLSEFSVEEILELHLRMRSTTRFFNRQRLLAARAGWGAEGLVIDQDDAACLLELPEGVHVARHAPRVRHDRARWVEERRIAPNV